MNTKTQHEIYMETHTANIALLDAGIKAIEAGDMELYLRISNARKEVAELWEDLFDKEVGA